MGGLQHGEPTHSARGSRDPRTAVAAVKASQAFTPSDGGDFQTELSVEEHAGAKS